MNTCAASTDSNRIGTTVGVGEIRSRIIGGLPVTSDKIFSHIDIAPALDLFLEPPVTISAVMSFDIPVVDDDYNIRFIKPSI